VRVDALEGDPLAEGKNLDVGGDDGGQGLVDVVVADMDVVGQIRGEILDAAALEVVAEGVLVAEPRGAADVRKAPNTADGFSQAANEVASGLTFERLNDTLHIRVVRFQLLLYPFKLPDSSI